MSINKLSVLILIFALSSCGIFFKPACQSIVISDEELLDSIASNYKNQGVSAVSLHIKGQVDKGISLDQFQLPAGEIDAVTEPFDYYSPTYHYIISNPNGAKGDLELCVTFYH
ncbi:hypothetical protein [Algoriphagus yeomjeoni]|uniref:Uncharacterized protein n=1 Tax=Algoriphagus yeomjeoni TaxID=291403 RepID=A0A327PV68_9BACT|nr:hypothetical protein [Algoriphagus yeomjeoni]RAI95201.1 hypothetical protein LV83_00452 [Algoriphagus yeomjeoni]